MSDWTSGYVADIGYTFGYYHELNPLRARLAILNSGLTYPEIGVACELGFGQGISVNMHAAASATSWFGTDFNPAQAGFAQELTAISGSDAKLYDDAFADFANRTDLPDFDFIGIHGIWSWISDKNRASLVDFIRTKLKVGGLLYISYNTLPGWASFAPIRYLMTEHSEKIGATGHGIVSRINGALDFTEKFFATNPAFAVANPHVADRMVKINEQNRHYLAHEYFNRDWLPMHFATMAKLLEPAKVNYACSAHPLDHVDAINLSEQQQTFLKDIPDAMFRQSVRDFMVNQQFRRDYWVRGARSLNPLEQAELLRAQRVVLVAHRSDVLLKVTGTFEASLSETIYNPLLDLLSDHKPRTLGQIEQSLKSKEVTFSHVLQASMVLMGAGHLSAAQEDAIVAMAKKRTDKLNDYLINKARGSSDISHLACPVTGGGHHCRSLPEIVFTGKPEGEKTTGVGSVCLANS